MTKKELEKVLTLLKAAKRLMEEVDDDRAKIDAATGIYLSSAIVGVEDIFGVKP
jgi:hypothetical protein